MAKIFFNTYQDYNTAKELNLSTIAIGSPIFEIDADGLLTGRFIIDHQFTPEQLTELEANGLSPEAESVK